MYILDKILEELPQYNSGKERDSLRKLYVTLEDMSHSKHLQKDGICNEMLNSDIKDIHFYYTYENKSISEIVLETESTKYNYKIVLREELVCMSYDDSYYKPVINFYKFKEEDIYEYSGGEYQLDEALLNLDEILKEPEITMDCIHRDALIEYHQRELEKLTQ